MSNISQIPKNSKHGINYLLAIIKASALKQIIMSVKPYYLNQMFFNTAK